MAADIPMITTILTNTGNKDIKEIILDARKVITSLDAMLQLGIGNASMWAQHERSIGDAITAIEVLVAAPYLQRECRSYEENAVNQMREERDEMRLTIKTLEKQRDKYQETYYRLRHALKNLYETYAAPSVSI
jgi:hypothetical protein